MWQQSGSSERMQFEDAKKWITELNLKGFAGFNDWRLPTLEEAMSLMEPEQKNGNNWIYVQGSMIRTLTFNYEGRLAMIESSRK